MTNASSNTTLHAMGAEARRAGRVLGLSSCETRDQALYAMADALVAHTDAILEANRQDCAAGSQLSVAAQDRLALTQERVAAMADAVREVAELPDPLGRISAHWERPNGLRIRRVHTPLGVVGMIYESRPDVTAHAASLCLKSGNACILRAGSDSFASAQAILVCLHEGLEAAGLPLGCINMPPDTDRAAVSALLGGLDGNVDVVIPRGGRGLVSKVQSEARVPVFAHLEGVCHVYVHKAADPQMACAVTLNAKMRRTGVCGAAEALLIDEGARALMPRLLTTLLDAGCKVHGDEAVCAVDSRVVPATAADKGREYLDAVIYAHMVEDIDAAMQVIAQDGSGHTEAIITEDKDAAEHFLHGVDSAIVLHNASTQFADGGEFGMGAEIGIATGRMHARGPIGLEQLTTFKYQVLGQGQTRP